MTTMTEKLPILHVNTLSQYLPVATNQTTMTFDLKANFHLPSVYPMGNTNGYFFKGIGGTDMFLGSKALISVYDLLDQQ